MRIVSKIGFNENLNNFWTKKTQPTTLLSLINSKETSRKWKDKPDRVSLETEIKVSRKRWNIKLFSDNKQKPKLKTSLKVPTTSTCELIRFPAQMLYSLPIGFHRFRKPYTLLAMWIVDPESIHQVLLRASIKFDSKQVKVKLHFFLSHFLYLRQSFFICPTFL